jgi:quinol-cytochrome oxidoreductase complex cytochrome b subunit
MRPTFFHHLHPPTIPAPQARWRYTLGAGGLAFFLSLVLIFTGALEAFYYTPTSDGASLSIQTITFLVPFGSLLRGLHYWSAQLLVVVAVIHLLRVIFTGAYTLPRRGNYWIGLALLALVLFLDFTGYALRWDSGVHWALVAGTNLLKTIPLIGPSIYAIAVGGGEIGQATIVRFYGWHLFGLMLGFVGLGAWHIFRVRRDGGIAVPQPELRRDPARITRFELVRREVLAMLLAGAGLIILSALFPAPLAGPISENSGLSGETHAPWFFLWVQQLLKLGNPFIFGVLFPLLALGFLTAIPVLFPHIDPTERGCWFPRSGRPVQVFVTALFLTILILTFMALS